MARPKLDIDANQVLRLAEIGTPNVDIAYVMGCSPDTIENRFRAELDKGRANGRTRLRQRQMELALEGNVPMLIWLGKQMLGQTDKQELKAETKDTTLRFNWGAAKELQQLAAAEDAENS